MPTSYWQFFFIFRIYS